MTSIITYAGFWRRFAALFIDGLIVAVLGLPFLLVPAAQLTALLLWFLYYPFFNSSALQGTPGKVYLGLAVTTEAGVRLSFRTALIRELAEILSALMLGLGYFFNLFTDRRQTLHDLLAGTVVVRRPVPESLDLWGAWSGEFRRVLRFPAATPPPVPAAPAAGTSAAELETLFRLRQIGALTEEEYQRKKDEVLARL